jgi:hypothetical protein
MTNETNSKSKGIVLSLGLIASALVLATGLVCAVKRFKEAERSVSVRGLAEKDVEANLAIWSINWTVASDNLNDLSNTLAQQSKEIQTYLTSNGLSLSEIELQPAAIRDKKADYYNQQPMDFRYSGKGNLAVKTADIKAVKTCLSKMDELIKKGIVLGENGFITPPEFLYTDLNTVKPEMIATATKNAREAANKFAQDSDSQLGKIRRANQGLFEIFNRDNLTPEKKTIRVVTTVEYNLED